MKPNRFIVWGINYAPELTGIAPYNRYLCEHLKRQNHEVEMVTSFSYYPEWSKRPEDKGKWFRTEQVDNVAVHRCWHYVPQKPTTLKRIFHELSFVIFSFLRILTLPRPDAFIVISPPLLLGFAAWLASVIKRAPFVFHVQDLQPDAACGMGMVRKGWFINLLYKLEAFSYKKAARVSGITRGMIRVFKTKGVPDRKLILFPNGIEFNTPESLPKPGAFRQRLGIPSEQMLAIYAGNLGVKHGVDILLESARLLQNQPIRKVICGDGARREVLEQKALEMGLKNVTFLPLQPEKEYNEMMVDADVYFVTQQSGSGSLFFPSKLLKGLSFSKSIVVVADEKSELTEAADEGRFAVVVNPEHPDRLAAAQQFLANNPVEREALGRAGRKYADQFELNTILRSFERSLDSLIEERRSKSA